MPLLYVSGFSFRSMKFRRGLDKKWCFLDENFEFCRSGLCKKFLSNYVLAKIYI